VSKLSDISNRLRSSSLADARVRAHEVFDELWLDGAMTRPDAYRWLCEVMEKTEDEGHIARFDIDECRKLAEKVKRKIMEEKNPIVWGHSSYPDEGFMGAYTTKEAATKNGRELYGDDSFYVQAGYYGDVADVCPGLSNVFDGITEDMAEKAYEQWGDLAEDWPDVSDDARSELLAGLEEVTKVWMRKHLKAPGWMAIGEPEKIPELLKETT